jgi:hypothetical protein
MGMINKKGYVGDVLMWGILLVSMIFVVMLLWNLLSEASTSVDTNTAPVVAASLAQGTDGWAAGWDFAIVAGLGFMFLVSLTSAWVIGTDSKMFWISLIILIMFVLLLAVLNNTANAFFNDAAFMVVRSEMPGTSFIIDNLFWLCIGGAGLLLLVLFAKNKSEE